MNTIQRTLNDIKQKIPRAILDKVFIKNTIGGFHTPTSLDYKIRQEVIDARVIPDCNLMGGTEINVPLISLSPQILDPFNIVYRIPKSLTQNRSISRLLSMTYGEAGFMGMANLGTMGGSPLMDAAEGVMRAAMPIPIISTAYLSLVAENTVLVRDNVHLPGSLYLRCVVDADENFNHLPPASIKAFSKLAVLATKAYIFNNIIIDMDVAQLHGGVGVGRFREVVDGYADADELYETEFEEKWRAISMLSDPVQKQRSLKMIVGGRN